MSVDLAIRAVINTALNEVGYLEKATNTNLDSKTANAGSANYTKYARDLDSISGFYNAPKNGYQWCDMFVDWCFVKTFGISTAQNMLCQGIYGAGTVESSNYYKSANRWSTIPHIGDQIFFKYGGKIGHTGLVYNVDSSWVYTIEGNTSNGTTIIQNGGSVCKKQYLISNVAIAGYGRPNYELVKDDFMSDEEIYEAFMRVVNKKPTSSWAQQASQLAIKKGCFTDGDSDGLVDNPQAPITREQIALVLHKLGLF